MGSLGAQTRQGLANGGGKKAAVSDAEIRGSQAAHRPGFMGVGHVTAQWLLARRTLSYGSIQAGEMPKGPGSNRTSTSCCFRVHGRATSSGAASASTERRMCYVLVM